MYPLIYAKHRLYASKTCWEPYWEMIWIRVYVSINLDQFFETGSKPRREVLGLVQIKKNGTKEEMVKGRAWQTASLTAILAYHSKTGVLVLLIKFCSFSTRKCFSQCYRQWRNYKHVLPGRGARSVLKACTHHFRPQGWAVIPKLLSFGKRKSIQLYQLRGITGRYPVWVSHVIFIY